MKKSGKVTKRFLPGAGDEADLALPGRSPPINCGCNKYLSVLPPLTLALHSAWGRTPCLQGSRGLLSGGRGQESGDDSPVPPLGAWPAGVFVLGQVGFPGLSASGLHPGPSRMGLSRTRMCTFVLARPATGQGPVIHQVLPVDRAPPGVDSNSVIRHSRRHRERSGGCLPRAASVSCNCIPPNKGSLPIS